MVSLHQVEYARRYCPRTIALKDGRVVFDGPSSRLTHRTLVELYGSNSEELILPEAVPDFVPEYPEPATTKNPDMAPAFA